MLRGAKWIYLCGLLLLHFMICHSKSAIGPAPQAVTKYSGVEQNTGCLQIVLPMWIHDRVLLLAAGPREPLFLDPVNGVIGRLDLAVLLRLPQRERIMQRRGEFPSCIRLSHLKCLFVIRLGWGLLVSVELPFDLSGLVDIIICDTWQRPSGPEERYYFHGLCI